MNDDPQTGPVFPQYAPPNPNAVALLSHPKQQKPLMKMISKMLRPKMKPRTSTKKAGKRKKREVA